MYRFWPLLFTATAACASAFSAGAQTPGSTYPVRPIRMVVPFASGGGVDIIGRIVAAKLSEELGQQVIVDNRVGAGSTVGTDIVAKARIQPE